MFVLGAINFGDYAVEIDGQIFAVVYRYSAVFRLCHVRPSSIATQRAEAGVRYPSLPPEHGLNERVGVERISQLVSAASV